MQSEVEKLSIQKRLWNDFPDHMGLRIPFFYFDGKQPLDFFEIETPFLKNLKDEHFFISKNVYKHETYDSFLRKVILKQRK